MDITPEVLASFAGMLLALLFEYVPGLAPWYDKLEQVRKQLVMLGLVVAVALIAFGLSCGGYLNSVACDDKGALGLLWTVGLALTANQGVHMITRKASASE